MTTNTLTKTKTLNNGRLITNLFNKIEKIIINSRNKVAYQVNNTLVKTYYNIGRI